MKRKILLVDDDSLVLRSVAHLVKNKGYDVIEASDGLTAVDKVKDEDFDLIICDVRMPGVDGLETIKRIRKILAEAGRKRPKEMFLTGYAEKEIEREARRMGVSKYIYKPFDVSEFMSAIDEVISNE